MKKFLTALILIPVFSSAQSDIENVLKLGQVIVSGFSIVKATKSATKEDSKTVAVVCIKNKLAEKITFKLSGKDNHEEKIVKELVVQNDGKECVFEIPKGIYAYEVLLANNEVYKKGEYKFEDDIVITVKKEDKSVIYFSNKNPVSNLIRDFLFYSIKNIVNSNIQFGKKFAFYFFAFNIRFGANVFSVL